MLKSILALSLILGGIAHAGEFKKEHPRRAEVNKRERNQQKRIADGIKNGSMNPAEASKIEGQEAAMKKEERADVKANGGHLTKEEQRKLNKEENQMSKEIYQDKHNGAAAPAPGPSNP